MGLNTILPIRRRQRNVRSPRFNALEQIVQDGDFVGSQVTKQLPLQAPRDRYDLVVDLSPLLAM